MEPLTLLTFTIAYAIAVLVPGPGVAAVVARALGGGFKGAFPMVLGILAGDLVYFVFAVFGLAAIATYFGPVFVVVRWAGAAYLLYIAYKFWTARPGAEQMKPRNEDGWKTFLAGFSLTMGNPKTIIFYLAILPTVIPLDQMTPLAFAELTFIVVVVLLVNRRCPCPVRAGSQCCQTTKPAAVAIMTLAVLLSLPRAFELLNISRAADASQA